jgi:hypothetical protein
MFNARLGGMVLVDAACQIPLSMKWFSEMMMSTGC